MTFSEIIKNNEWLSVEMVFLKLYPDQQKNIDGYKVVYGKLKVTPARKSSISIVIEQNKDEMDGSDYVDVYGKQTLQLPTDNDEPITSLALEFTNWDEWLGMEINIQTMNNFSELEIISHCLFEMTFVEFDEKDIQTYKEELNEAINEIKNMSEDENQKNRMPLKDLLRDLETGDNEE